MQYPDEKKLPDQHNLYLKHFTINIPSISEFGQVHYIEKGHMTEITNIMENSADPDETPREPPHPDLHRPHGQPTRSAGPKRLIHMGMIYL